MAKEWYLMNANTDIISGFESDDFNYFAENAFSEALLSPIAEDVELCNYDLTKRVKTRAIIQGKVQDTKLKSTQKSILAEIGTCKDKQYVYYKNRYWLIVGLVDNNGMYEKAVLALCNYLLTWQNEQGSIIQRWVNITTASQYNNGETENRNHDYVLRTDQLLILSPNDDECVCLDSGKRFVIDRRCKIYERHYSNDIIKDFKKPLIVYSLTRTDTVLYDYQDGGHHEFMVSQDEQQDADGYYIVDGNGYWLCGFNLKYSNSIDDKREVLSSAKIEYESTEIYNGLEPGVFTAKFYDPEGNEISIVPNWNIDCDFKNKVNIQYVDNSILISVDNEKLINKSLRLSLCNSGYQSDSITIKIKAFL